MQRLLLIVALAVVPACGGGSSAPARSPIAVSLGVVSSTAPTTMVVAIDNPTAEAVEVTVVREDGPFRVAPGALPDALAPGGRLDLPAQYVPDGRTGPAAGEIELAFTGARAAAARILELDAEVERVRVAVSTPALAFGDVAPGTSRDLPIDVRNRSARSTAHVGRVDLPAGFTLQTALPLAIEPGATGSLVVRYTPGDGASTSGTASIHCEDPSGPFPVPLTTSSGGRREVLELGLVAFDPSLAVPGNFNAQTQDLTFELPADAVSFQIEGYGQPNTQIGLSRLRGPNDEDFENESFTGFYLQYPDVETFVAQVPNTDLPAQQVIPGTWTFRIGRLIGTDPDVDVRVIVQRRPGGAAAGGALDLNIFLADGIALDNAGAAADADLQDVLERVDTLLAQQGVRIGDVDYYDLSDLTPVPSVYDDVTNFEFPGLLALSGHPAVQEERLNYFLVREALGGGVLGISAKLGGPTRGGTGASGVMGLYIDQPNAGQRDLVARVMAHEIGHFLGLRHTAEANGSHDYIADTTNCGSSSCTGAPDQYLMHWQALSGHTALTDGQGLVIRGHGHLRPLTGAEAPLAVTPQIHLTTGYDILVSENWCGTCNPQQFK